MALTLAISEAQLDLWVAASTAVAANQSYTIGDRALTRADAKEVREMIVFWQGQCLAQGGSTTPSARLAVVME